MMLLNLFLNMWKSRKGQLGIIEFKFFLFGILGGIVLAIILVYLANAGILPFKLSFLCPVVKK